MLIKGELLGANYQSNSHYGESNILATQKKQLVAKFQQDVMNFKSKKINTQVSALEE